MRHARRRRGGRSREKEPALKRSLIALVGLLAAVLVVAPAAGAPRQTPKHGGTVVFGPVGEFSCLNPFRDCGGVGPQFFWVFEKVIPGAFTLARDSTYRPELVSKGTVTRAPPFILTYAIRPDARWSDGFPVTARDFLFTHQAIRKYSPSDDPHRSYVESVRKVDAKTVRVVLRSRYAGWRGLFSIVLPQHALAGEDLTRVWTDGIENPKTRSPIGSGPFLVGSWTPGKQLTLVRNPKYWGPHTAYLDRLIVRFCETVCLAPPLAEVLEGLRTGAVDFAYARDTEIVPDLRRIRNTTVDLHRTNGSEHLEFRLDPPGHPALDSKIVRRAFAYSIDRAEIVRRLWGEIDPTYRPLQSAVLFDTDRYYAPNWNGYAYRPGLARSLLERAGYRRGVDDVYARGTERLSFRFITLPTRPRQRGLELMQAQLRRVGIEVVLSYDRALFDRAERGDFDVVSFAWLGADGFGQKDLYGCGVRRNYAGYCQRLVTADLDQAERTLDDLQRGRVLNRVDLRLAKDVPVIPLYQIPWVLAYSNSLRGVIASPGNLFWNAENWWLDD